MRSNHFYRAGELFMCRRGEFWTGSLLGRTVGTEIRFAFLADPSAGPPALVSQADAALPPLISCNVVWYMRSIAHW